MSKHKTHKPAPIVEGGIVAPDLQLKAEEAADIAEAPSNPPEVAAEPVIAEAAEVAPVETPLHKLSQDDLLKLCASLNAQIIALHGEGKHEEGDALRAKHMNAKQHLR